MFVSTRKTERGGVDQVRESRAQRHGAEEAQAPHRPAVHRGLQGLGRGLPLGGRREEFRGSSVPVSRGCRHRTHEGAALRLHSKTSRKLNVERVVTCLQIGPVEFSNRFNVVLSESKKFNGFCKSFSTSYERSFALFWWYCSWS